MARNRESAETRFQPPKPLDAEVHKTLSEALRELVKELRETRKELEERMNGRGELRSG